MSFRVVITPLRERTENQPEIGEIIVDNNYGDISVLNNENNLESGTKQIQSDLIISQIKSKDISSKIENSINGLGYYLNDDFNVNTDLNNNILGSLNYIQKEYEKYFGNNYLKENFDLESLVEKIYSKDNNTSYSHKLRQLLLKIIDDENINISTIKELNLNNLQEKLVNEFQNKLETFERKLDEFEYLLDDFETYSNSRTGSIVSELNKTFNNYFNTKENLKSKKFINYNKDIFNNEENPSFIPSNMINKETNEAITKEQGILQTENKIYNDYINIFNSKNAFYLNSPLLGNEHYKLYYSYYKKKGAFVDHFISSPLSENFDGDDNLFFVNSTFYYTTKEKELDGFNQNHFWNNYNNSKVYYKYFDEGSNIIPPNISSDNRIKYETVVYDNRYNKRVFLDDQTYQKMYEDRMRFLTSSILSQSRYLLSDNTAQKIYLYKAYDFENFFFYLPSTYHLNYNFIPNINWLNNKILHNSELYSKTFSNFKNNNNSNDNNKRILDYTYNQFITSLNLSSYNSNEGNSENNENKEKSFIYTRKEIRRDGTNSLASYSYKNIIDIYTNKQKYADSLDPQFYYYTGRGIQSTINRNEIANNNWKKVEMDISDHHKSMTKHLAYIISGFEKLINSSNLRPNCRTFCILYDGQYYYSVELIASTNTTTTFIKDQKIHIKKLDENYKILETYDDKNWSYNSYNNSYSVSFSNDDKTCIFDFIYKTKTWKNCIKEYLIPESIKRILRNKQYTQPGYYTLNLDNYNLDITYNIEGTSESDEKNTIFKTDFREFYNESGE